jgi:hypothetical protein
MKIVMLLLKGVVPHNHVPRERNLIMFPPKSDHAPRGANVFEILYDHNFCILVLIEMLSTTKL